MFLCVSDCMVCKVCYFKGAEHNEQFGMKWKKGNCGEKTECVPTSCCFQPNMEISFEIWPVCWDICKSKSSMGSYSKNCITEIVGTTANSTKFLSSFNLQTVGILIQLKRNRWREAAQSNLFLKALEWNYEPKASWYCIIITMFFGLGQVLADM